MHLLAYNTPLTSSCLYKELQRQLSLLVNLFIIGMEFLAFSVILLATGSTMSTPVSNSALQTVSIATLGLLTQICQANQLLPWIQDANQATAEERSKEWVETCDTHMTKIKVNFPGCISKSIKARDVEINHVTKGRQIVVCLPHHECNILSVEMQTLGCFLAGFQVGVRL